MMYPFITALVVVTGVVCLTHGKICPRDKSRVVARVVRERIFPAFNALRLAPPPKCMFSLERDMYAIQEDNKVMENGGRWTCNFCGKAFVSEYFLDRHFENRHEDQIQMEDSVCLADVCDVFRCDIISGASVPDYWDIALCLEDDMEELNAQCQELAKDCIPSGLTRNETETIRNQIIEHVCSFLTCSKFWNTPYQEEENTHTALYIVLTTMSFFGIVVYNFVFYNYFYSDFDGQYDPTPRKKHKIKNYKDSLKAAEDSKARHRADRPAKVELEPA